MSQAGVKIANTHMVVAELQRDWSLPTGAATAVFHATGHRERRLPIRPNDLLS